MKEIIYRILKIILFILLLPFIYICGIATLGLILFGINRIGKEPLGEHKYVCGRFYSVSKDAVYWSPEVPECLGLASYKKISDDVDNFEILVDEEDLARDSKHLYGRGERIVSDLSMNQTKVIKKIKSGPNEKYYHQIYMSDNIYIYIYIYYQSTNTYKLEESKTDTWEYLGCEYSTDGERYYRGYRIVNKEEVVSTGCQEFVE